MSKLTDKIFQKKLDIVKQGNMLAVGDAEHDFKLFKTQIAKSINVLNEGLPNPAIKPAT